MDSPIRARTRNTAQGLEPGTWWTVEDVALNPALSLYYTLGRQPGHPSAHRDARGRTALEAFGSLRIGEMRAALERYFDSLDGVEGAGWENEPALAAIGELVAFVRTFGPIGIGWGGAFAVRNPEAERLGRGLDRAKGIDPDGAGNRELKGLWRSWAVSFWGHGPGRETVPVVRRLDSYGGRAWEERIRLEDPSLAQDRWEQIVDEHQDFLRTLELVEAIAQNEAFDCRKAVRAFFTSDDDAFSFGPAGPLGVDFSSALTGYHPANHVIQPFKVPLHQLDWVTFGRAWLAGLIGRQVDFAMPLIDISEDRRLEVRWRATSLLEVIYLQLLDHVRRRPGFGVGTCEKCAGPILRTRRKGGTGNRWHHGCTSGRMDRWRREHPGWRSGTAPGAERA